VTAEQEVNLKAYICASLRACICLLYPTLCPCTL